MFCFHPLNFPYSIFCINLLTKIFFSPSNLFHFLALHQFSKPNYRLFIVREESRAKRGCVRGGGMQLTCPEEQLTWKHRRDMKGKQQGSGRNLRGERRSVRGGRQMRWKAFDSTLYRRAPQVTPLFPPQPRLHMPYKVRHFQELSLGATRQLRLPFSLFVLFPVVFSYFKKVQFIRPDWVSFWGAAHSSKGSILQPVCHYALPNLRTQESTSRITAYLLRLPYPLPPSLSLYL